MVFEYECNMGFFQKEIQSVEKTKHNKTNNIKNRIPKWIQCYDIKI